MGDKTNRTQPFCVSVTTSMAPMWDYIEYNSNSREEIPNSVHPLAHQSATASCPNPGLCGAAPGPKVVPFST